MTLSLATNDGLALIAAIPVAALGGASFLKGVLGVAAWLRLPKLLVATTLAAFATSSPELAVSSLAGLAALILAGRLFVTGASGIAVALGVHPYLIGVTVVAVGTSLPELVTVLLSRLRGHDDVGLGTLLGSNLFNGLAIVGVTATIHPIRAPLGEVAAALAFGLLTVLLMLPSAGTIPRRRGLALLAAYAVFVVVTVALPV